MKEQRQWRGAYQCNAREASPYKYLYINSISLNIYIYIYIYFCNNENTNIANAPFVRLHFERLESN
jgi:hypothetical protein